MTPISLEDLTAKIAERDYSWADFTVYTDDKTPEQVADEIIRILVELHRYGWYGDIR